MKVLNIHKRIINQPKQQVANLLGTLASREDKIWPFENWPRMKFKEGIQPGAKGGHGPIRYSVETYDPNVLIQFRFYKPKGFNGIHKLEISEIDETHTMLKHTIDMQTSGVGIFSWFFAIRWLHDALIEDAFDKVENNFGTTSKKTNWNLWVRFLRKVLK
ncbi:hypothetical protein [Aquimarina sp. 2201CG5-10]|uniref:hypothetical protein n=1 Tax=Aquimarina callyspongiae TaxID=3098150 RepID=UPI002AB5CC39|nr:hypothetical protein [Aquimarina sp. 2201CG5-10]MDY8137441.1 hypothetical protein [Aquimarina sp. 2201CG5-10]